MATFKCKMCGGALEITEGLTTCECSYCGTTQTLPTLNDEKKANLYDRANHFRRNNDFDKAMHGYKDTNALADKCQAEIDRIKEEERLEAERLEAARRKEAARQAKKKKTITAIVAVVTVAIIVVYMVVTKVVIPNNNYNNAVALMNSGEYIEAYELFDSLNGFKDSKELKESIYYDYEIAKLNVSEIGDTVYFGNYNGNTEWIVLAREDGKVLVISKYALERRPYNTVNMSVSWKDCTLRNWLNGAYLSSAFSSDEQARIVETSIPNPYNSKYGTNGGLNGGLNTTDKVFPLSIDEVNKYFKSDSERKATLTDGTSVWWWLRSPGSSRAYAARVDRDGSVGEYGCNVTNANGAVRPALWIDISNL